MPMRKGRLKRKKKIVYVDLPLHTGYEPEEKIVRQFREMVKQATHGTGKLVGLRVTIKRLK